MTAWLMALDLLQKHPTAYLPPAISRPQPRPQQLHAATLARRGRAEKCQITRDRRKQHLTRFMRKGQLYSYASMLELLPGVSEKALRRIVEELTREGKLFRDPCSEGRGKRHYWRLNHA